MLKDGLNLVEPVTIAALAQHGWTLACIEIMYVKLKEDVCPLTHGQ